MNVNKKMRHQMQLLPFVFLLLCFICSPILQAEEVITDIILINGQAELVDLSVDGDVLQRHMSIPDYFSSGRSHKKTLRESLAKTRLFGLSTKEEEYIETIVFKAPKECRQSLMRQSSLAELDSPKALSKESIIATTLDESLDGSSLYSFQAPTPIYHLDGNRVAIRKQRTLIEERFLDVSLFFRTTSRTSKAIIDV